MGRKTINLGIRASAADRDALRQMAMERGMTVQSLVETAVKFYLAHTSRAGSGDPRASLAPHDLVLLDNAAEIFERSGDWRSTLLRANVAAMAQLFEEDRRVLRQPGKPSPEIQRVFLDLEEAMRSLRREYLPQADSGSAEARPKTEPWRSVFKETRPPRKKQLLPPTD